MLLTQRSECERQGITRRPRPAKTGRREATLLLGGPISGQASPSCCREQGRQGASRMQREGDGCATQGARAKQRAKEGANQSQAGGQIRGSGGGRRRGACGSQQMNGCSAGSCECHACGAVPTEHRS